MECSSLDNKNIKSNNLIKKISAIAITSALLSLSGCDLAINNRRYRSRPYSSYHNRKPLRSYHKLGRPFNNGPYNRFNRFGRHNRFNGHRWNHSNPGLRIIIPFNKNHR